jgi:geranylgeranyl diphosphate synthase type I
VLAPDPVLERFERYLEDAVLTHATDSPVDAMIRYHFGYAAEASPRHGKRLRSRLLLHVVASEGAPLEDGLDAAAAVEILHNYSLVHDDIEDGDALRHGRETVWSRYGSAHGINTGDTMCAISYLTLLEGAWPPARIAEMTRRLHAANLAMCAGQARDLSFEERDAVAEDEYLAMIDGKTAALFAVACELGALAAGCDAARAADYALLGRTFGRAFQIQDDALGVWGSSAATGKPSGADLSRRKWSYPVVWALGLPPSAERDVVARCYAARSPLAQTDVAEVVAALDALGAAAAVADAAERHFREGKRIVAERGLDPAGTVGAFLSTHVRRSA